MPPGKRRITTTRAALGALAFLAGATLWWSWPGGEVGASEAGTTTPSPPEARPSTPYNERDEALGGKVQGIVQAAISEARGRGAAAGSCRVAVLVKELGVEGALVEMEPDRPLRPASNLKLATTAVALALLGPTANFETSFEAAAPPQAGVLSGDLIVRAGADPLYQEGLKGECGSLLKPWVRELSDSGVRQVTGDLVLDLGSYAAPAPAPGWPSSNQHWKDYCALSSGFTANAGCITIEVEATGIGQPARVSVYPRGHGAELELNAVTGPRGGELDLRAVVSAERIRVWGSIPVDVKTWTERYAHPDPVALFGSVLSAALEDGGVHLEGSIRRERAASGGVFLATLRSPIVSALRAINTDSNNAVADQLFYMVGAEVSGSGDREGGVRAAREALLRLGLDPDAFQQVDGSGLSRDNRVTARQIVRLLDSVISAGDDGTTAFIQSLAVSGKSGTLEERMVGTTAEGRVTGKTGFIGGTSALSGVARSEDERFLVFSVLVEYPVMGGLNREVWKPMQDRICEVLVRDA